MRFLGLLLVLMLGASAAPPPVPLLVTSAESRRAAPAGAPVPAVAQLGYDLRLPGNHVLSPLSVLIAYGMIRAAVPDDLHLALNTLDRQVRSPQVSMANGLFVQPGFPVGEPFLDTLARDYGAGVHRVELPTARGAKLVNNWVATHTRGRITHVYDPRPNDRVVLVNAIHLDADWAQPFDANATAPLPFTTATGETVDVPTMQRHGETPYARGAGWQAVDLPYDSGDLVMRILLPDAGADPADLLEPARLASIGAAMQTRPVSVLLPKWETETTLDLLTSPRAAMFTQADLSGIAPGLSISSAVHRAWITVDEKGTEAAAATSVSMMVSALAPPEIELRADRPFAFAILHRPTGVPLFTGRVADPRP